MAKQEDTKADTAAQTDVAAMSFEAALKQLESIVDRLESGDIELEESIAKYELGESLKARCEALLKDAEARVEKITLKVDGTVAGAEPLDVEDGG